MFDTPNRVLSPGPTFNEVRGSGSRCHDDKKFSAGGQVGGYMSLAKKTTKSGNIATPIIFLNAANPKSKSREPVKVLDPVKIGFAPYKWGQYDKDIIPDLESGTPAAQLSNTNYHALFSKQNSNTNANDISGSTHRYLAIDNSDESLTGLVTEDQANDMNYTFYLSNSV